MCDSDLWSDRRRSEALKHQRISLRRETAFRWLALILSATVAFLVAEITFRLAISDHHELSVSPTGSQYRFYRYDPVLGWANAAGATGRFERDEFSYTISINEHGMRQRSVSLQPQPGRLRIATLGDSFLWGIGVSDEDRVTELLAAELGRVDVLNFGVSGYSPVQYHLMVDKVADFSPQLAIVFFCLGNDFGDNVLRVRYGYYRPYAILDGENRLEIRGYPIPTVGDFGFRVHSRLMGSEILGKTKQLMMPRSTVQAGLIGFDDHLIYNDRRENSSQLQKIRSHAIEINQALLAEIRNGFARRGIDLMVVSVPTKLDIGGENYLNDSRLVAEHELGVTCRNLGLSFFPAVHLFDLDDFWVEDAHWNRSGHRVMAVALAKYLSSHPIIAPRLDSPEFSSPCTDSPYSPKTSH